MNYTTGKHCLTIGNIVSDDEVKWSDNKILIDDLQEFMQSYISTYSTTEISRQGIVDFIRSNAGIELVVDDRLKQQLMERGIDLGSLYTVSKEEQKGDINQPGYSREENGTSYTEKQQQVLKDATGKEIGNRTITWNTNIQKGIESIETVGTLENNDGNYSIREVSETLGGELQLHRRELTNHNKNTMEQQSYHEQPETKTHSTENPESFRSKMRFEMTQDQYQEILDRHTATEENFAKEMAEDPEKKKTEQTEHGVR